MMIEGSEEERHSKAEIADLVSDPEEKARREARNGLRQFDLVLDFVESWLPPDRPFRLRLSTILQLHRTALDGLSSYAGNFRPGNIEIGGSGHEPKGAHLVPGLVEDLCDYVNDKWNEKSAIHLAAYSMWRLNWIHPFTDGNGRTSRALSYLVLCVKLGYRLPGSRTIPDQISENKTPYYEALEKADKEFEKGTVDVSAMEELLSAMLATQLMEVHREATGNH